MAGYSEYPGMTWSEAVAMGSRPLPKLIFLDAVPLGGRLKAWREYRGLRHYVLEKKSGVSHYVVARIEAGIIQNPQLKTVVRLAEALGITVTELVGK